MSKPINDGKQIKLGAVFSYLLIILNTVYGLFMSPYILSRVGDSDFGVYKTIASFSAALLVLDLGIGTTVMRYTAKYRAEKQHDKIGNFVAMGLIEASIMGLILFGVSLGIYASLDGIYGSSFTPSELALAKNIFLVTVVTMIGTIFDNVFHGVIMGTNRFIFANGLKLATLLLRILLSYVILYIFPNAVALVLISLCITLLSVILGFFYTRCRLKIRIRIVSWDKAVFKESLGYTLLMFIQTLAVQANGNIDNIVIGAVIGSTAVAVYSFGIQMFNMYESLATSFSNLMLPKVSEKIAGGADDHEMQQLVTRVGRIQFMVLGAALIGFACIGQDFIDLWLGEGYEDVYYLSLLLMVPVTFTLIENVCLSILRARNLMKFRTLSLILTASFNALFTVVGMICLKNYYAAAWGTALSILLGSIIMMNIYYHKKIGFRVFRFYYDVLRRLAVCAVVPGLALLLLNRFISGFWLGFLLKALVYCILYVGLLLLYGMDKQEKQLFIGKLLKRRDNQNG